MLYTMISSIGVVVAIVYGSKTTRNNRRGLEQHTQVKQWAHTQDHQPQHMISCMPIL
jgi:hypothetical protein